MADTVSICIPSHNCGRYLRATIESALDQRVAADEILISDDHSTDNSVSILDEYRGDPRLRIVHQDKRLSLGAHYRFLLENATSSHVCFLSADDVIFETFVGHMKAALEDEVTLVVGGCVETDEWLRVMCTRGTGRRPVMSPDAAFPYFVTANNYTMSFALMHCATLRALPALPVEFDVVTDWYWALSLARSGKVAFVTTPEGYYRVHGGNAGHGNDNWGIGAKKLLPWLTPQLDADQRALIQRKVHTASLDARVGSSSLTAQFKKIVKRVDALRYRSCAASARRANAAERN